jgi:hypothetical protein
MPFVAHCALRQAPVEITQDWGLRDPSLGFAYTLCRHFSTRFAAHYLSTTDLPTDNCLAHNGHKQRRTPESYPRDSIKTHAVNLSPLKPHKKIRISLQSESLLKATHNHPSKNNIAQALHNIYFYTPPIRGQSF